MLQDPASTSHQVRHLLCHILCFRFNCVSSILIFVWLLLQFSHHLWHLLTSKLFHYCHDEVEYRCQTVSHYVFPGILKSTCYIDVRWFPFDVQKCDLKFGSWTHNGWLLDLQMIDVDISTYIPNGEWDLVGEM